MNKLPRDPLFRRAFLSLLAVSVFHGMNHTFSIFLSPLNENIRMYFGVASVSAITSFKTTYLVVYAASNLLFGVLTNRLSARKTLAAGGVLNGLAVAGFALVGPEHLGLMYLLWAVAGFGGGVYHPVANVLITRLFPERKGWAIGLTGMGASTGFAFGPFVTGFLHGPLGLAWQPIAFIFGSAGVLIGFMVLVIVKDLPAEKTSRSGADAVSAAARLSGTGGNDGGMRGGSARPVWGESAAGPVFAAAPLMVFLGYVIFATGLREITMWSVMDISDFYLSSVYAAGSSTAWFLFIMYLAGIFVQPLAGTFSDRVGRLRLATFSLLLHGSAVVLLVVVPQPLLFLPFLLIGIGQSGSVPTVEAMVADFTNTRNRGLVFGVMVTVSMGLGATGPLLSGIFIDSLGGTAEAYRLCILILGGLTILSAFLMSLSGLLRKRLHLSGAV